MAHNPEYIKKVLKQHAKLNNRKEDLIKFLKTNYPMVEIWKFEDYIETLSKIKKFD